MGNHESCALTEVEADDGGCCPAGALVTSDGCVAAGVPASACGEGFASDGQGGCVAVAPAGCGPGTMTVLGETACLPMAGCGAAPWGDIPVDDTTAYVDQGYVGNDSDGSAERPWTTIQAAVDSAAAASLVAIAAGQYVENVLVLGKAVRLWGRCPSLVEVVPAPAMGGAVFIETNAGSEVHNLSITGGNPDGGLLISAATELLIDGVWIHDLPGRAINVQATLGPTSLSIRNSLVERSEMGMFLAGATVDLRDVEVRDTSPNEGIVVRTYQGIPSHVTIDGAVLARNARTGLRISSSTVSVNRALISDTVAAVDGPPGSETAAGLGAFEESETNMPTTVTATSCVFERNTGTGVFLGGVAATLEAITIRDTKPMVDRLGANALVVTRDYLEGQSSEHASLTLRGAALVDNYGVGALFAVDGEVERLLVRGTRSEEGSSAGAVGVAAGVAEGGVTLALRGSDISANEGLGLLLDGCTATVESTHVHDQLPGPTLRGDGIVVQRGFANLLASTVTLDRVVIADNHRVGITVLSSAATLRHGSVRGTLVSAADGNYGDGISVQTREGPASLFVDRCSLEGNARAGLSNFGASVTLGGSELTCNAIDLNGETTYAAYDNAFTFEDTGGNTCGCGDTDVQCAVQSSGLEPQPPPEPPVVTGS